MIKVFFFKRVRGTDKNMYIKFGFKRNVNRRFDNLV